MPRWKWIIYNGHDFTNKYQVSDEGEIRSVDRWTKRNRQFFPGRIIKQRDTKKRGNTKYKTVTLWDDGKQVDIEVHRLVAVAFIENPEGKKCVNHKDGDGTNNKAVNLEWCTFSENAKHSVQILGNNPKRWKAKPVEQKTLDGKIVKIWESAWEIQRQLGFCQVSISRCCRRQKKSGIQYGYIWDFHEVKGGDNNVDE